MIADVFVREEVMGLYLLRADVEWKWNGDWLKLTGKGEGGRLDGWPWELRDESAFDRDASTWITLPVRELWLPRDAIKCVVVA